MSQKKILKILSEKGRLSATQIIDEIRVDDESKEFIRTVLKQMRKYHEIGFILVGICGDRKDKKFNVETDDGDKKVVKEKFLYEEFPELKDKKITRACYLYFTK